MFDTLTLEVALAVVSALFFLLAVVFLCWAVYSADEYGPYDERGYSDAELARKQEREAAARLRPASGWVTPLGGEEPPTAYGTRTDGIGNGR
jgi:nitrogen fixation-related uncharacterized protein